MLVRFNSSLASFCFSCALISFLEFLRYFLFGSFSPVCVPVSFWLRVSLSSFCVHVSALLWWVFLVLIAVLNYEAAAASNAEQRCGGACVCPCLWPGSKARTGACGSWAGGSPRQAGNACGQPTSGKHAKWPSAGAAQEATTRQPKVSSIFFSFSFSAHTYILHALLINLVNCF